MSARMMLHSAPERPELTELLRQSAQCPLTPAEIVAQRHSFVRGQTGHDLSPESDPIGFALLAAERRVAELEADLARWQRIARDRLRLLKAERKARGETHVPPRP